MGLLRVILAVSVLLGHAGPLFGCEIAGGQPAVEIFFIISGFFMAMILTEKYHPVRDRFLFYSNRALRIYSTYYLVLILALGIEAFMWVTGRPGVFTLWHNDRAWMTPSDMLWVIGTNIVLIGQESLLFLQPSPQGLTWSFVPHPQVYPLATLRPAWSLGLELLFYLIAPFIVRLRTRWIGILALLSLGARFAAYHFGLDHDPWNYRFFPFELALFLMGVISYRLYKGFDHGAGRVLRIAMVILLFAGVFSLRYAIVKCEAFGYASDVVLLWPFYAFVVLALPCLFVETARSKIDATLGDLSYPIYLVHYPIIVLYSGGLILDSTTRNSLTILVLTLAVSWPILWLVDKPINRFRQARVSKRPAGVETGRDVYSPRLPVANNPAE